jgi:hypothetical protein
VFLRAREASFVTRALHAPFAGAWLQSGRIAGLRLAALLPSAVLDVLPDLLWAFAAGAMLRAFDPGRRANVVWAIVGAACVLGYEVAQAWHLVPGTFDWHDLVAEALGFGAGWAAAARLVVTRPTLSVTSRGTMP